MGKVLNVGSNVGSIPQRGLNAASTVLFRVVYELDNGIQRAATFVGLSGYAASRFTYTTATGSAEAVRNFNRILVLFITLFFIFFISGWRYVDVVENIEVPVLGWLESDVNLYYPPIGRFFSPKVPAYNEPPKFRPRTPLLIPFTRNNTMMRQTVLSYIAAGWPRADIVIVDNSGTMDGNNNDLLSRTNPFYLDYDLYRKKYGVALLQTPTLLSFAQLQNFMLRQAIIRDWPYFFWSHMDIAVLSAEEYNKPYKSFYHNVLNVLDSSHLDQWQIKAPESEYLADQKTLSARLPSHNRREIFAGWFDRSEAKPSESGIALQAKRKRSMNKRMIWSKPSWAVKFFAYDYLTLVNVDAWKEIGQWDPFIPYYNTDCDFYERMKMAGYRSEEVSVGHVFDVADTVEDPERRFFPPVEHSGRDQWSIPTAEKKQEPLGGEINSPRYQWLKAELTKLVEKKSSNPAGRNSWQSGGLDERGPGLKNGKPVRHKLDPWTYDPRGFQAAWWSAADGGRMAYVKKWGTLDCNLKDQGLTLNDMWMLEYVQSGTNVSEERWKKQKKYMDQLNEKDLR